MNDHIYNYQRVLIGGDLNAITRAHKTSSYFINNSNRFIFPFDPFDNGNNLGLGFNTALESWNHTSYSLTEHGLNPFGNRVMSINVDRSASILEVTTKDYNTIKIKYDHLSVYDLENISGLPDVETKVINYRVFDWFDVKSGARHDHTSLESEDDFCQKIYFYISERIMGNKKYKDLVCESVLDEADYSSIKYSSTLARFKIIDMMEQSGILGTSNGVGKHRPIQLEFNHRNIVKNELIIYKKYDNIELGVRI